MPPAQEVELRGLGHVAGQVILRRHDRAVLADLFLVRHVLVRESKRLLVQEERRDGVRGKRQLGELLSQMREPILLYSNSRPLSGGQGGRNGFRHGDDSVTKPTRRAKAPKKSIRKILVIDVGGTHVKVLVTGKREPLKLPSGPELTPKEMVASVLAATAGWDYDAITVGYPGPVAKHRPSREPANLGSGWVGFNYSKAFGVPVRIINDAAMQALGSYEGGRMLFLGLGTGLGTALVFDGIVIPLELAHLPYHKDKEYEDYIGEAGMRRLGQKKWKKHVEEVVRLFIAAVNADYAVLGGGNVRHFDELPPHCRRGNNAYAFRGGFRLWKSDAAAR